MTGIQSEIARGLDFRETARKLLRGGTASPAPSDPAHDLFRAIVEALPAAIYVTDTSGRITYYNAAAATLWGCHPKLGESEFCGSWKLYRPDGTPLPHDQCPMAIALKEQRSVRGMEAVAERPDGTRVPFIPYPTPLFDESGNLIGAVNMLVDISERAGVEHRLAAIVDSSDDAIASKDLNGIVQSWNAGAERLFGYSAREMVGRPISILIPPDRRDEEQDILTRIRRGERVENYDTVRRCKDGRLIHISLAVSPIFDEEGRVIGASKIARDITERKRSEETSMLLVRELNHRVKNSLATVQVIARQSFKRAPREERQSFDSRLQALAGAHDLLLRREWNRASIGEVANRALQPFQEQHRERIVIEGPEVWLEANRSTLLTMVIHELATNAVKYGALSNESGCVRVVWSVAPDHADVVRLVWHESGVPGTRPPGAKGFGSRLIEMASRELGTSALEFGADGLTCTLDLRIEPIADLD